MTRQDHWLSAEPRMPILSPLCASTWPTCGLGPSLRSWVTGRPGAAWASHRPSEQKLWCVVAFSDGLWLVLGFCSKLKRQTFWGQGWNQCSECLSGPHKAAFPCTCLKTKPVESSTHLLLCITFIPAKGFLSSKVPSWERIRTEKGPVPLPARPFHHHPHWFIQSLVLNLAVSPPAFKRQGCGLDSPWFLPTLGLTQPILEEDRTPNWAPSLSQLPVLSAAWTQLSSKRAG